MIGCILIEDKFTTPRMVDEKQENKLRRAQARGKISQGVNPVCYQAGYFIVLLVADFVAFKPRDKMRPVGRGLHITKTYN